MVYASTCVCVNFLGILFKKASSLLPSHVEWIIMPFHLYICLKTGSFINLRSLLIEKKHVYTHKVDDFTDNQI